MKKNISSIYVPWHKEEKSSFKDFWSTVTSLISAAMFWITFGFDVIPILPGTKKTALKWDPWLKNLSVRKIYAYWTEHPEHELGCIVGDDLIVLDTDTPESLSALTELEALHDLKPRLVVKTKKGEHHYYRRAPATIAKSDSHDSDKFPDRIDIKTGRALAILPISTGKIISVLEVENKDELSEATQEFIDTIYRHNGRTAPSESGKHDRPHEAPADKGIYWFELSLKSIDPDCGYDDWIRVGMAIFHETQGSDYGLALFDEWSSKGKKYKGLPEIEAKWRSFRLDIENPVKIGTLLKMAYEADQFEPCDYVVTGK